MRLYFSVLSALLLSLLPLSLSTPVDEQAVHSVLVPHLAHVSPKILSHGRFSRNENTSDRSTALSTSVHQKCAADGLSFADSLSLGCKSFSDLIGDAADAANGGLTGLTKVNIKDRQISSILNSIVNPIVGGLEQHLNQLKTLPAGVPVSSVLNSNVCLGNFAKFEVFKDYKGVCGNLPLSGEWTVLGFSLDVGIGSPFHSLCPTITDSLGTFASVCIAISVDECDKAPSVALSMSTSVLSCTPFDSIFASSTAGLSVAVIKAVDIAYDSFTFGVSLSNAFRKKFKTYDGNKVIPNFVAPGSFYMGGELALSPKAISLPDVFQLSGESTQMFGVNAPVSQVKDVVNGLTTSSKAGAAAVLDLVKGGQFSILNSLVLNLKFSFSNLKKSGKGADKGKSVSFAIPDSDPFEIGTASLFATSYTVISGSDRLKPGLYVYGSASAGNILKGLLKYMLKFTGEILSFLPDWLPPGLKLDPSDLAEQIKISGSSDGDFAFGLAATLPDKIVFFLRVPLIIKELGYIRIRCEVDIGHESFKCSVKTAFNEQIFGAIGDAIEDGALWVAKKLDNFADDVVDKGKEVLAVGMSTLGDAAKDVGSVFSKDTVKATAQAIKDGKVAMDKLGDAAGEVASWAAKATGELDDFMDDVGRVVETGVKKIGKAGKKAINEAKDLFDDAQDELESAAKAFASGVQCSVVSVVSTLTGKSTACPRTNLVAKSLVKVGRNVDRAFNDITKTFASVTNKVGKAIADAVQQVFGVGNQRRKKVSVSSRKLPSRHKETGCPLTEYTLVTRWEKRTCVLVCGKWRHDRTDREVLGSIPQEDCVKKVVEGVKVAMAKADKVKPLEKKFSTLKNSDSACTLAQDIKAITLTSFGLVCKTTLYHEKGVNHKTIKFFIVPATVTCSVPQISTDGKLSKKISVSLTRNVPVTANGIVKSSLSSLKTKVIAMIVSEVAKNCKAK